MIKKWAAGGHLWHQAPQNCCLLLHAVLAPDLYIMEVKKDEKGNLKAVLKDTAIKDWQNPYHQECPMKW